MHKGLNRMRHGALCRGLEAWREYHAEAVRIGALLSTAILRLTKQRETRGFGAWNVFLLQARKQQQLMALAKRSSAKIRHPRMVRIWDQWKSEARLWSALRQRPQPQHSGSELCKVLARFQVCSIHFCSNRAAGMDEAGELDKALAARSASPSRRAQPHIPSLSISPTKAIQ